MEEMEKFSHKLNFTFSSLTSGIFDVILHVHLSRQEIPRNTDNKQRIPSIRLTPAFAFENGDLLYSFSNVIHRIVNSLCQKHVLPAYHHKAIDFGNRYLPPLGKIHVGSQISTYQSAMLEHDLNGCQRFLFY
jgi:hypothetical protein